MRTRLLALTLLMGLVLSPVPLLAQEPEGVRATPQGVLVDFQDADLRLVLAALAEAADLNVVFSDIPARRITLRMGQPVQPQNLLPLLRSIAESNGLRVIEEVGFVRIEGVPGAATGRAGQQRAPTAAPAELRLFVYRLKHVRADRLAATLQAVFGGAMPVQTPGLSRAPLSERLREQRIAPVTPGEPAAPAQAAPVLTELPAQLRGELQIVPDETTNSLLVRAQPEDWEVVRQAIEALDLRPLQVLIEVVIAEVRRSRELDVGVTGRGSDQPGTPPNNQLSGELRRTGELVLEILQVGGIDLDVAVSALSSSGQVRIVSRPVILAQNNEEARILVGSQRPFVQVFRSLPTDAAIRDQIVQYRDVGTLLTIKPTINPDGYVNLQLIQEVSSATTETQFGAPVISTREASTHLFVRDGQTAVIGGLIERQQDLTRSGIPLLKDIPGLGFLFGSTRHSTAHAELFILVTPRIVYGDEDLERIRSDAEEGSPVMRRELPRTRPLVPRESSGARPPE